MSKSLIDRRQRLRVWYVRVFRHWPFVLWCSLGLVTIWGVDFESGETQALGVVHFPKQVVAIDEPHLVKEIVVQTGDRLEAGALLMVLGKSESARSEQRKERENHTQKRFAALSELEVDLIKLEREIQEETAALNVLRAEWKRLRELKRTGLVDESDVVEIQLQVVILESRLSSHEGEAAVLRRQSQSWESLFGDPEIVAQEEGGEVRADVAGIVSRLYKTKGDVALAGDRLIELIIDESPIIQGFLPLTSEQGLDVGQIVYVAQRTGDIYRGTITSINPGVSSIQDATNPIMTRTVVGRSFTVEIEEPCMAIDGEQVDLQFKEPSKLFESKFWRRLWN